jgi:16S rRNA (cytidine1402-2'-O)-methyltransferase
VLCRELTKLHEEVARGTLAELAERFADGARGELVIVVGGAPAGEASLEDGVARVLQLVEAGGGLKEASAEVAAHTGLSRRELYEAAIRSRPS